MADIMSLKDLQAQIAAVAAENAKLKAALAAKPARTFKLKVSEKGALSAYGIGRFPVTLYRSQWEHVLTHADDIRQFIADHSAALAVKAE